MTEEQRNGGGMPDQPPSTREENLKRRRDYANQLLDVLFGYVDNPWVELRAFRPERAGTSVIRSYPWDKRELLIADALGLAFQADVYIGVGARRGSTGGSKPDVAALGALWADVDTADGVHARKDCPTQGEALARLDQFQLRPTLIVHSGGGLHLYWRLKEPWLLACDADVAAAESMLRRLAVEVGGDMQVCDVARILRLPGTCNLKGGKKRPVRVVKASDVEVNLGEFEALLPPDPVQARAPGPAKPADANAPEGAARRRFANRFLPCMGHYALIGPSDGERHACRLRSAAHLRREGFSAEGALVELRRLDGRVSLPADAERDIGAVVHDVWDGRHGDGYASLGCEDPAWVGDGRRCGPPERARCPVWQWQHQEQAPPPSDGPPGPDPPPPGPPSAQSDGDPQDESRPPLPLAFDLQYATLTVVEWLRATSDPPELFLRDGVLSELRTVREEARITEVGLYELRARLLAKTRPVSAYKGKTVAGKHLVDLCRNVLMQKHLPVPELEGVIRYPAFGPGGVRMFRAGYYPETRLYVDLGRLAAPDVPERPTREECAEAVRVLLDELLVDFKFVDQASRANALALVLVPFLVPLLDTYLPMWCVTAPTPGSGKGLLVQAALLAAVGQETMALQNGRDGDDMRKRITAALLGSPTALLLDNLDPRRTVDNADLAALLTRDWWDDRELNFSRNVRVKNRFVWAATGNNPTFTGELGRRMVLVRIDPKSEKPAERTGWKHALPDWAEQERPLLVRSALTLISAWIAEGMPEGDVVMGSFERVVRALSGALDVAGVAGFMKNRDQITANMDAEANAWAPFFQAWWQRYQDGWVQVDSLRGMADSEGLIQKVLGDGGERSQRARLTSALRTLVGRPFAGYALDEPEADAHAKAARYRLTKLVVPAEEGSK